MLWFIITSVWCGSDCRIWNLNNDHCTVQSGRKSNLPPFDLIRSAKTVRSIINIATQFSFDKLIRDHNTDYNYYYYLFLHSFLCFFPLETQKRRRWWWKKCKTKIFFFRPLKASISIDTYEHTLSFRCQLAKSKRNKYFICPRSLDPNSNCM